MTSTTESPSSRSARGRLGGMKRLGTPADDPRWLEARQDLAEAKIRHYLEVELAKAPALRAEQVERLRATLGGAA